MLLMVKSPAGQLEALLEPGSMEPRPGVALVCHPHPQYGGTLNNKVVFRTSQALREVGMATLRFNFRGVGKSSGSYDFGEGEQEDVAAALDFLTSEYCGAHIWLAGYSFGAWVGLKVGASDDRVFGLIGIGMPAATADLRFLADCRKPKLFVQGTHDEFGSVEQINALLLTIPEPKEVHYIDGADHFFNGKLDELKSAIKEYITTWLPAEPPHSA
jgi:hypothetical protein